MITATELLEFLTKAQRVCAANGVSFQQVYGGYKIVLYADWRDNNNYHRQSVFIDNKGNSTWDCGDYDFGTMDGLLDEMIERGKEKEIKEQKRKELIESLTPEQRELLGV